MDLPPILRLTPRYLPKVWGGRRLQPGSADPIGEAWIVAGDSRIAGGSLGGATLDDLTRSAPLDLLGRASDDGEFPLLIKLLEATEWLSVQVHPDDALARKLAGPGSRGKTEAWYVIDAAPGAELIVGLNEGVGIAELKAAANDSSVLDLLARMPVAARDTYFMPAGTVHAIGPGVLIYEVQQMSDITYRLYDWERPASAGRELHVEQSLHVLRALEAQTMARQRNRAAGASERVASDFFVLEELALECQTVERATAGESFHAVTAVGGIVQVAASGEAVHLGDRETALIPAATGRYRLAVESEATILVASLPTP